MGLGRIDVHIAVRTTRRAHGRPLNNPFDFFASNLLG
jgi:hypothetical protein